jgi:hypothetical protein
MIDMRNIKYGDNELSDKKIEFWYNRWINFSLKYAFFMYRGAVTVLISRIRRKINQQNDIEM